MQRIAKLVDENKTGRSWNAEYFHLEMGDILYPEDRSRMEEIKQADPAAVVVNGYYSGYLGEDMSLDELTAGVRHHYENGYTRILSGFLISISGSFAASSQSALAEIRMPGAVIPPMKVPFSSTIS